MGHVEVEGGLQPSHDDMCRLLRMHLNIPDPSVQELERLYPSDRLYCDRAQEKKKNKKQKRKIA